MEVGRFGKPREAGIGIGINFLEALKSKDRCSEECRNCTEQDGSCAKNK